MRQTSSVTSVKCSSLFLVDDFIHTSDIKSDACQVLIIADFIHTSSLFVENIIHT